MAIPRSFAEGHGGTRRPNLGCIPPRNSALLRVPPWNSLHFLVLISFLALGCTKEDPSPPKTPAEELTTFQLEPGLRIELIASEPMVEDPVVITFDEDGRLWVVEMRGFMHDVEGTGEDQRTGRVSVLQDLSGDGIMDTSTVYLDSLIMPRALAVVKGGALVVEDQKLWFAADTNSDLIADSKTLVDPNYGGPPMPEHSPNGLWRGIDNWYYNAKSSIRYKSINGAWQRDTTEFRGQWGLSHDDKGRLFYNYNWSQLHADLVPPNYLSRNPNHTPTSGIDHGVTLDRRVYPIRPNPAVNRGYIPGTLDEDGKLLEFTAACSPFVFRGRALSSEYYGNAFVAEPSGNLVKRNVVSENGVILSAHDPHPGREFLASTDERFRPVSITSGPDGALYVADMYRGLVQHALYVTPYLRDQTLSRNLLQPVHYGRIWRIVSTDWVQPDHKPLSASSTSELVQSLGSTNGWVRDMAQRLLVEKNDKSGLPQLDSAVRFGNNFQRLHALWTLEGMNATNWNQLFAMQNDRDDAVANTALRLMEPFARADPRKRETLGTRAVSMVVYANDPRQLQFVLSSTVFDQKSRLAVIEAALAQDSIPAIMRDAAMSSLQNEELILLGRLRDAWTTSSQDKEIFIESLSSAIVNNKNRSQIAQLLNLANVGNWFSASILTGITTLSPLKPPVQLSKRPSIMETTADSIILQRLSQMFEWPGHKIDTTTSATRQLSERDQQRFAEGRKLYLTSCASCHGTNGAGMPRLGPTLIDSEWVIGDERRLALLVLHGIEGPIEVRGKQYDVPEILPVMPSHSTMDDGAITSILTYIRNEWGNDAGALNPRTVGQTRHLTQGRVMPWTVKELNEHVADSSAAAVD